MRREANASIEIRTVEMLALAQAELDAAAVKSGEMILLPNSALVKAVPQAAQIETVQSASSPQIHP